MLGFLEWFILFCIVVAIVIIGVRWLLSIPEMPQPLKLMLILFVVAVLLILFFNYAGAALGSVSAPRLHGRWF